MSSNLPLANLKVIDTSRLLPGPYASLMLADLGADVLKIEDPNGGDYLRWTGSQKEGLNPVFAQLNRNKRSLTLNLKAPAGRHIFRQIIADADVLIESFRPSVMRRLELDYERLKILNPRLIYCSISGYGQTGPYADWVGHDLNYIGYAGILERKGERPVVPNMQIADMAGGSMMALVAILAALEGRHSSGAGRYLDISMTHSLIGLQPYQAATFLANGNSDAPDGWQLSGSQPEYTIYEAADGKYLTVAPLEPKFFARLCELLDLPYRKLTDATPEQIRLDLIAKFAQKPRDEWLVLLADQETCVGPVLALDEVFDDPQTIARGSVVETEQHGKQLGLPFRFNDFEAQAVLRQPAPAFGEHTDQILATLGYDDAAIAALRADGIIGKLESRSF